MKHLTVLSLLTIFTDCVSNEVSSWTAIYENEKLLCNSSAAITSIQRFEVVGLYGKDFRYKIHCSSLNTCDEDCEWSDECTEKEYGKGVYIGGIHSLFFAPTQKRYIILLCCNGSGSLDHSGKLTYHDEDEYIISAPVAQFLTDVKVNRFPDEQPHITTRFSSYISNPSANTTGCSLLDNDITRDTIWYRGSLSPLAGLVGLAGLVIDKGNSEPPPPTDPPPPAGGDPNCNQYCLGATSTSLESNACFARRAGGPTLPGCLCHSQDASFCTLPINGITYCCCVPGQPPYYCGP